MIKIISKKKLRKKQHDYGSTHVIVPDVIAKPILNWGKINVPDYDLFSDPKDGSLGREEESHITVKYGLHTDNPDEVKKIIAGFGSFPVSLGKIDKFESPEHDVLIIKINSPKIKELNELISENLDYTDSHPRYIPHLTIAYVKKGIGKEYVGSDRFEGDEFTVQEIEFVNKHSESTIIKL